ncbi:MAG: hypothetical protein N3D78_01345 [Candidatus Aenigmarchaeota archaeon]|nr:hypothetical protein [Candidatus Aenigmarchaeota archaeon]
MIIRNLELQLIDVHGMGTKRITDIQVKLKKILEEVFEENFKISLSKENDYRFSVEAKSNDDKKTIKLDFNRIYTKKGTVHDGVELFIDGVDLGDNKSKDGIINLLEALQPADFNSISHTKLTNEFRDYFFNKNRERARKGEPYILSAWFLTPKSRLDEKILIEISEYLFPGVTLHLTYQFNSNDAIIFIAEEKGKKGYGKEIIAFEIYNNYFGHKSYNIGTIVRELEISEEDLKNAIMEIMWAINPIISVSYSHDDIFKKVEEERFAKIVRFFNYNYKNYT